MKYHPDDVKIGLQDLFRRITESDLVPGRIPLLEGIDEKFHLLRKADVKNAQDLRLRLKTPKSIAALSKQTGIDEHYLSLLRREIESCFPRPYPLKNFDWLSERDLNKLEAKGCKNSKDIFNALSSLKKRETLARELDIAPFFLETLFRLAVLTRIQWVSPRFAQMLLSAGYGSSQDIARANAETLSAALDEADKDKRLFKGKIGIRDVKRVIKAASYVE